MQKGELLNEASIASGISVPFATLDTFADFPNPNLDLGDYGEFFPAVTALWGAYENRDVFGWAHMLIASDGVEMLDNAVSCGDPLGIIVGVTIPEPPGIFLAILVSGNPLRCCPPTQVRHQNLLRPAV